MKFRAFSSTSLVVMAGIAASGSMICETAFAQTPRTLYLYNATPGRGRGFQMAATAKPWGNGNIRATRRGVDYEGASVQEVESKNFAEGVRFDLNAPLDLTPYQATGFFRLRVRFQDAQVPGAPGGEGGPPPEGGFPGGGFPGGGFPGGGGFQGGGGGFPGGGGFQGGGGGFQRGGGNNGGGGGGGFGAFQPNSAPLPAENDLLKPLWIHNAQFTPPGNGALPQFGGPMFGGPTPEGVTVPTGPAPQETTIKEFRVTFIRETGVTVGRIPVDLEATQPDANGWRLLILAVRDMKSTADAAGAVTRILLTTDNEDKYYLAQAALAVETGKMTVSIRRSQDPAGTQTGEIEVKPGRISLVADLEAGTGDPTIEWDFDADKNGNLPAPFINGGAFPAQPAPEGGAPAPELTGPRIDARGLVATFDYPNEEQNYRVQVTVRDKTGQKEPVTASLLVKVRG